MKDYSYWENKPLKLIESTDDISKTSFEIKPLLDKDSLLSQIEKELNNSKVQLDYKWVNVVDDQLVDFINKNYVPLNGGDLSLYYTKDLINYFMGQVEGSEQVEGPEQVGVIVLQFYPKGKNTPVGLIMGKKHTLVVHNNKLNTVEVNFLCLDKKLRNMHVSSYMINILARECILKLMIHTAHYTIGDKIKSPYFSDKYYIHRPINIKILCETKFFSGNPNQYNFPIKSRSDSILFKYINGYNKDTNANANANANIKFDSECEFIYWKLKEYNEKNYDIYEEIDLLDIKNTFMNKAFHHFLFYEKVEEKEILVNYVCFYILESINLQNNKKFKNAILYRIFTNGNSFNLLELIVNYSHKHDLFDVITVDSSFKDGHNSYVKGTGHLKYYFYNLNIPKIPEYRNGLVTL